MSGLLQQLADAMTAARKARELLELPEGDWGSTSPLTQAKTVGRRCGDLLQVLDKQPEEAEPLLAKLPDPPLS